MYSFEPIKDSNSDGLLGFSLIIHPSSYGLLLIKPGDSASFELTSTTSPEIGELTSLVALTLSTAPKLPPCETEAPGLAVPQTLTPQDGPEHDR